MNFFQKIKSDLEEKLEDFSTIEHVLIVENSNTYLYRLQQAEGDSLVVLSDKPLHNSHKQVFNDVFLTAVEARKNITKFIIECLT